MKLLGTKWFFSCVAVEILSLRASLTGQKCRVSLRSSVVRETFKAKAHILMSILEV